MSDAPSEGTRPAGPPGDGAGIPGAAVPRLVAGAVVRRDRVRDEDQLLLPERVVRLNASSAAILRGCDGRRTVDELLVDLRAQFGVPAGGEGDIRPDVERFLADAAGRGWVTW